VLRPLQITRANRYLFHYSISILGFQRQNTDHWALRALQCLHVSDFTYHTIELELKDENISLNAVAEVFSNHYLLLGAEAANWQRLFPRNKTHRLAWR